MRICHNDAIVDIICYGLSQSHPGVLKEQQASCEDHSRPSDVYHPYYIFSVAILPTFIYQFAVLLILPIFLLLLLVLRLLLWLGSWPRTSDIKML